MTRKELRSKGFDIEVQPIGDASKGVWHKTGYYRWVVSCWETDNSLIHREFSVAVYPSYEDAETAAIEYCNLNI